MRCRVLLVAAALGVGAGACADLLGIDDGIPRDADTSPDGTAPRDAASDAFDARADVPFVPLSCGASACNVAAGEACCRTGATQYACVATPSACAGTLIPCDRPSQCPPTDAGRSACCVTSVVVDGGGYVAESVACKPYDSCLGTPAHYILCGDDDAAADCPAEAGCGPSTATLPPFLICK